MLQSYRSLSNSSSPQASQTSSVPPFSSFFFSSLKAPFIFAQSFPELSLADLLPKVPQNQVCSSPFKKHTFLPDVVPCFFPHTHKKLCWGRKKKTCCNDIRICLLLSRAAGRWCAHGYMKIKSSFLSTSTWKTGQSKSFYNAVIHCPSCSSVSLDEPTPPASAWLLPPLKRLL